MKKHLALSLTVLETVFVILLNAIPLTRRPPAPGYRVSAMTPTPAAARPRASLRGRDFENRSERRDQLFDPGGFGAVTITKSITIDCHEVFGSILNAGTNGINIAFDSFAGTGCEEDGKYS